MITGLTHHTHTFRIRACHWRLIGSLLLGASAAAAAPAQERALVSTPFYWFDLAEHLSADVQLGDLDGDGDLDVALANGRHWAQPDFAFFNLGDGRLLEATPLGSTLRPTYTIRLADLDRDGQPSVIALNDGTGRFTEHELPASIADTRRVVTGDFNGDGQVDVALGVIGAANVVYQGNGSGGFRRSASFGSSDGRTYALAAADLDLDGDLDFVEGNDEQANAYYFNTGAGSTFERFQLADEAADTYGVAIGDMNGDGHPDVVFASSENVNEVYLNRPVER